MLVIGEYVRESSDELATSSFLTVASVSVIVEYRLPGCFREAERKNFINILQWKLSSFDW